MPPFLNTYGPLDSPDEGHLFSHMLARLHSRGGGPGPMAYPNPGMNRPVEASDSREGDESAHYMIGFGRLDAPAAREK
jgi:hypothetical protein